MEMKRLNATGLRAAGYDERSRTLVVETTSGTWEYVNVSPEIYRRLMVSRFGRNDPLALFFHSIYNSTLHIIRG